MLFTKEDHAANPPPTWQTRRSGRVWRLETNDGAHIGTFQTKRDAEDAKRYGWAVTLYTREGRWYAGEHVPGWKQYSEC